MWTPRPAAENRATAPGDFGRGSDTIRRMFRIASVAVALAASWALAAEPAPKPEAKPATEATRNPSARRVGVVLLATDAASEALTTRMETYAADALKEFERYRVKTSDDVFPVVVDTAAEAALKKAEGEVAEGKAAYEARKFDEAEKKLRTAIRDYTAAAAAMKACDRLCDAVAMYAASLFIRGDVEEAKLTLLDLLALAPTFELDRKRYPQEFIVLRATVASAKVGTQRGALSVRSKPAGAAVFIDGESAGYAPLALNNLAVGKHLVVVEKAGFTRTGSLVDVTPADAIVFPTLTPSSSMTAYDAARARLRAEFDKSPFPASLNTISKGMGLDDAIVATLKTEGENSLVLDSAFYDLGAGKKLANRRSVFQGDEYGQLKAEVGRLVNYLVNNARGGEAKVRSSDPLERTHGTEDWSADDKGGRATQKAKKKKGDPLEGVSGTEEW